MNDATELDLSSESPAVTFEVKLRQLLHEWFVVYNPLYFASALSFLAGVFLASEELTPLDWRWGDLALLGIVQVYELALVGAAVLLWRAGAHRPATILLLLEALFLFDPTCEIETFIHLEPWDLPLAGGWLLLAAFKVETLARAFGHRLNRLTYLVILGFAATIVAPPLLFDAFPHAAGLLHPLVLLLMLGLAAVASSGRCGFAAPEGEDGADRVAKACLNGVLALGASLALLHLLSWLYVFDIRPGLLHLAAIALVWLARLKSEAAIWTAGAFLLLVLSLQPEDFSPIAACLGLLLAWRAFREARPGLYGAALLCLDLAVRTIGWSQGSFPSDLHWIDFAVLAALAVLAWKKRVYLGILIALTPTLPKVASSYTQLDKAERAITLIAAAFLFLAAGLLVNLRRRV